MIPHKGIKVVVKSNTSKRNVTQQGKGWWHVEQHCNFIPAIANGTSEFWKLGFKS